MRTASSRFFRTTSNRLKVNAAAEAIRYAWRYVKVCGFSYPFELGAP